MTYNIEHRRENYYLVFGEIGTGELICKAFGESEVTRATMQRIADVLNEDPGKQLRLEQLERENAQLRALLYRFFHDGSSLGGSHPHLAEYVAYPAALWDETRAVLNQAKNSPCPPAKPS